ncbi:hypothetical protein PT974_08014 [Cladobotryum mycophilum]|uniref:Rhodopsin domain-containing protein n=1 Tax=Cladobotryum mycophilum TaxID=491253 RepID=A0ABR0SC70_9HYPO
MSEDVIFIILMELNTIDLGLAAFVGLALTAAYIGLAWAFYAQLHYGGYFVHQWDIRFKDSQKAIFVAVILPFIYSVVMIFAKTAILFEWTHIFVPTSTRNAFFWTCRVMMILNFLLYSAGMIAEGVTCIPIAKTWTPWLSGKCIDKKFLDVSTACFNLAMDLLILFLPQGVIWKLQMTRNRKMGVSIIFSFGILTIACAAMRVWSNSHLAYVNDVGDSNYGLAALYLCGFAETTCVLLVFAVPALPKAYTESRLGCRVTAIIRSWKQASKSNPSNNNGAKPHILHRVKDEDSQTQLREMGSVRTKASYSSYTHGPYQEDGGIVCHTKIETTEDAASTTSDSDLFSSQYPWTGRP